MSLVIQCTDRSPYNTVGSPSNTLTSPLSINSDILDQSF